MTKEPLTSKNPEIPTAARTSKSRQELSALERKEAALISRIEELEMLISGMGGGKGAELLAVESEVAKNQLILDGQKSRIEELSAEIAKVELDAKQFIDEQKNAVAALEQRKLVVAQEVEREASRLNNLDVEFVRQCLDTPASPPPGRPQWEKIRIDCEKVLNQLARTLSSPRSAEVLKAVIPAIRHLDRLDALNEGALARSAEVLRVQLTEALSNLGVYEYDVTAGTEIEPEVTQMMEALPGLEGAYVVNTLRTGFLMEQAGAPPVILRPALVVPGEDSLSLAA